MNKKKFISTAKDVINLEIKALQQLKKSINNSFNDAVVQISKCQSKVIFSHGYIEALEDKILIYRWHL